jgi:hypothetical protein
MPALWALTVYKGVRGFSFLPTGADKFQFYLHGSKEEMNPQDGVYDVEGEEKNGPESVGSPKFSGWVSRDVFNKLDTAIQSKVAVAIEKGIVPPTGNSGIIRLTASEAAQTGYQFKIKILGKGGDIRIYGNPMSNGHVFFDKIMRH